MKKIFFLLLITLISKLTSAQTTYTFIGNGSWTTTTNWSSNTIPPNILPSGSIIYISPAVGGTCVLNIAQTISQGANIIVTTGANFIISGGLIINNTTLPFPSVTICSQKWMTKNLDVSTYRNGDLIPQVTDPNIWQYLRTGAWRYYNNDSANNNIYGKLYNWYALNDPRGLAPIGWHVPSQLEIDALSTCLGDINGAGGKLKETGTSHWNSPNVGATNSTGFTGLPNPDGNYGYYWTSTEELSDQALYYILSYNDNYLAGNGGPKNISNSVRCVNDSNYTIPIVQTWGPGNVTTTTAKIGGNIYANLYPTITRKGVVYSTSPIVDSTSITGGGKIISSDNGEGNFSDTLTNLVPNTTYYFSAFAVNSIGVAYGIGLVFTTLSANPILTTTAASAITSTTAVFGGNITYDGGSSITARGVVWSTSTSPTIALSTKTIDGTGTGSYISNLTGLLPNTVYYIRAYATNNLVTSYGNQISFTTPIALSTLSTNAMSSITNTAAVCGGNISNAGGGTVTARGVIWSTIPNPTIALTTKTSDGTGTGSYTSNISSLLPNTTYNVRAYATNAAGTSYGNEISFTTLLIAPIFLTTNQITFVSNTSAISGGNITFDGGSAITSRGIIWSTSPNPTTALTTKTSDGTGTGSYTTNLTGLLSNTTYYVRAYAINSNLTTYGNEYSFITLPQPNFTTICSQVWMTNNLDVTTYRNGDTIPQVTNLAQWSSLNTGAWCYYNNDSANGKGYGKLYNWYAVNDARGLAPQGWHVASDSEYTILSNCLGGLTVAGGTMKETGTTHWLSPNTGATNSSGFTAVGGGYRNQIGNFFSLGGNSYLWSSTSNSGTIWYRSLGSSNASLFRSSAIRLNGYAVRCVKD